MEPAALAFDAIAQDFLARCEPADELTVAAAWTALLANAELPVIRTHPPHSADDYVGFLVSAQDSDARVMVTVERRIAMISGLGDYAGTRLLRCDLLVAAGVEPWTAEGYVPAYEQLDTDDDRPPLDAFRTAVEASAAFAATREAEVLAAGALSGWQ